MASAGVAAVTLLASSLIAPAAVIGAQDPRAGDAYVLGSDEFDDVPESFFATSVFEGLKNKAGALMVPQPQFNDQYTFVVLGFGDSFGSGEGAPDGPPQDYSDQSAEDILDRSEHLENFTGGTFSNWTDNTCHLSTNSAVYQHIANLRKSNNVVGANFACTGAESYHIVGSNYLSCLATMRTAAVGRPGRQGLCSDAKEQVLAEVRIPRSQANTGRNVATSGWAGSDSLGSGSIRKSAGADAILPSMRPPVETNPEDLLGDPTGLTHQVLFGDYVRDEDWSEACSVDRDSEEYLTAVLADHIPGLARNCEEPYQSERYESQLWHADKWLQSLKSEEARRGRQVVILGSYISAGGNDRGFGPVFANALGESYEGSEGLHDSTLEKSIREFPSITWQLQATYTLLDEYMRQWNDSVVVKDRAATTSVDALMKPSIWVQGYPTGGTKNVNSTDGWCDEVEPDNDTGTTFALIEDLQKGESKFINDVLVKDLMADVTSAVQRATYQGISTHLIETSFEDNAVCRATAPPRETDDAPEELGSGITYAEADWDSLEPYLENTRFANNDIDAEQRQGRDMFGSWVPLGYGAILVSKGAIHPNYWGYRLVFENGRRLIADDVSSKVELFPAKGNPDEWRSASECESSRKGYAAFDTSISRLSSEAIYNLARQGNSYWATIGVGGQLLRGALQMASTKDQFPVGAPQSVVNSINGQSLYANSPTGLRGSPFNRGIPSRIQEFGPQGPSSWRTQQEDGGFAVPYARNPSPWRPAEVRADLARGFNRYGGYLYEDQMRSVRLVASGTVTSETTATAPVDPRRPNRESPYLGLRLGDPLPDGQTDFWFNNNMLEIITLRTCAYSDGVVVLIRDMNGRVLVADATQVGGVRWEYLPKYFSFDEGGDNYFAEGLRQLPISARNEFTTKHLWFLAYGDAGGRLYGGGYDTAGQRVIEWPTLLPIRNFHLTRTSPVSVYDLSALKLNPADKFRWRTSTELELEERWGTCPAVPDFSRLASGPYAQNVLNINDASPMWVMSSGSGDGKKTGFLGNAQPAYSCTQGAPNDFAAAVSIQCSSVVAENAARGYFRGAEFAGRPPTRPVGVNLCDMAELFR